MGGGKGALVSENKSLTIATGNYQTLFLFEGNRVGDPRVHENVSPSVMARWGTGGNNVPQILVDDRRVGPTIHNEVPTLQAFMGTGGNNIPMTFAQRQSNSEFVIDEVSSTVTAHEHKQFSDLVIESEPKAFDTYNQVVTDKNQTLSSAESDSSHYGTIWKDSIVRRLTPRECERLQGFPDDWTASQADSSRYKMMGNAVTVPVVEWIVNRMVKLVTE